MTTIKNHTDLEQSEKLAEILPLESADMMYVYDRHLDKLYGDTPYVIGYKVVNKDVDFPCWSLTALLNIINKNFYPNIFHDGEAWNIEVVHHDNNAIRYDTHCNDVIDGVFEMILKLHESKTL